MLNQQTLTRLRDLRLPGMAAAYEEEQRQGNVGQLSFDDRFGLLVEKEWGMRQERRTQRRLKDARLKEEAWLEDADLDSARGLSREVARELGTCNWIRAKKNLLILDDFGLCPLEQEAQHSLLELIDDRVSSRSTIVTSQLPVENWYGTFTDPTVAEALLDRLLGHSQKVKLTGPSRRPKTDKKGKEG